MRSDNWLVTVDPRKNLRLKEQALKIQVSEVTAEVIMKKTIQAQERTAHHAKNQLTGLLHGQTLSLETEANKRRLRYFM
jgi:hypothetical protein